MIFPAKLTVKSATSPLTLCKASALFCAISWLAFSFKRPASSLASAKISALLFSAVSFAFSIIVLASVRLPANSASRLLASSSAFLRASSAPSISEEIFSARSAKMLEIFPQAYFFTKKINKRKEPAIRIKSPIMVLIVKSIF